MTDPRPTLLLSRPRADSEGFAARFRARHGVDWPVIVAPVIEIAPVAAPVPTFTAAIFTSRHAVAPLVAQTPAAGRRAYCVGARTAEAARAAGFDTVTGPGDAATLVELIRAAPPGGRLLHARGDESAFPVADRLNSAGIETIEAILYRQEVQDLPADLLARIDAAHVLAAPVFSPRSARLLAGHLAGRGLDLRVAVISPAVAEAARALNPTQLRIAETPDTAGVWAALLRLLGLADPG